MKIFLMTFMVLEHHHNFPIIGDPIPANLVEATEIGLMGNEHDGA